MAQTVVNNFGDLDCWSIFYLLSHALGMKCWNRHAKFHTNRSSINGCYALHPHIDTKLYDTLKLKSIVLQIPSGLD